MARGAGEVRLGGLTEDLLRDVTLVGNDTGGALVQLVAGDGAARVGRIVLVSLRRVRQLPAEPPRLGAGPERQAAARGAMLTAAEALPGFDRPALVVWASEDRVMPPEHGRRLAELLPQGRLEEVPDSYTLVPLDQPAPLARLIGAFAP